FQVIAGIDHVAAPGADRDTESRGGEPGAGKTDAGKAERPRKPGAAKGHRYRRYDAVIAAAGHTGGRTDAERT
ncbi:MAG: hypothetical protein ACREB6_11850, partial [Rhodospirillales bacterium]